MRRAKPGASSERSKASVALLHRHFFGILYELSTRNILPSDIKEKKDTLKNEEDIALTEGKQAGLFGQVIGWLTVFSLLGVFMGYYYAYSKTISKYTGKAYFKYNEPSRQNGKYLFYTALVLSCLAIVYKVFKFEINNSS